jgi:hypothetical protein
MARAVLLALREPDEGMIDAGAIWPNTPEDYEGETGPSEGLRAESKGVFTAMIDHILNETGTKPT